MTRIIAGAARGRRLQVPPAGTRPTTDRVREALFSTLAAKCGGLDGLRVLDLFAGSGALGLEALSRGADAVVLVESAKAVVRVLQRNLDAVGLPGATIAAVPVQRYLEDPPDTAFDVVLADPPYSMTDATVSEFLGQLVHGWLRPDALLMLERPRGQEVRWPPPLAAVDERRYGDTVLWYGRAA